MFVSVDSRNLLLDLVYHFCAFGPGDHDDSCQRCYRRLCEYLLMGNFKGLTFVSSHMWKIIPTWNFERISSCPNQNKPKQTNKNPTKPLFGHLFWWLILMLQDQNVCKGKKPSIVSPLHFVVEEARAPKN